jgi:hypothetical protein
MSDQSIFNTDIVFNCAAGYACSNMTVAHYMERSGPIRRQLLGAATGGIGYTSPSDADVPLRTWMLDRMDKESVRRCSDEFLPLTSEARL